MSLKACVDRIFALNTNYSYPDQAVNQASSLQVLSDDLYSDPFRFVYELIQNADDASSTELKIALIENNYLIVSHNGRIFNEKDLRSICAVNNSTKTGESQTVGYKGLGFKAVFGKSNYVLIITNGDAFRFDERFEFKWKWKDITKNEWEQTNERKFIYPWQICPIWTDNKEISKCVYDWVSNNNMSVNIIIRLKDLDKTRHVLEELAIQPHTFLFLRHIRQVEFAGLSQELVICTEEKSDGSLKLSCNRNECSRWLVSRRQITMPPEAFKDVRLPEKLRSGCSTEIGLAAKIDITDEKTFIPVLESDSVLFAYMPTKISTYKLPLLINANFLTNANREQIHTDSIWNQWIFEFIPRETIEWIKELIKTSNWSNTAYHLLPKPTRVQDTLANKYNVSCSNSLSDIKFISDAHGKYLTVREAIIDSTDLSNQQCVGAESIRQYLMHQDNTKPTYLPLHPFIPDHDRLRECGVREFNWDHAIDMFNSSIFQEKFSIDQDIQLIVYLFHQRNTDKEISKLLHRIPFIMDRNNRLQIATKIYFPSEYDDESWHTADCQEAYVHQDLMKGLQLQYRQWLETLGVTTKTDLTFFFRTIVPQASTFITHDNAVSTIQRIFNLYTFGQITQEHLKSISEISLLTTENSLRPANHLYLPLSYCPRLLLDNVLPTTTNLFVSPAYLNNNLCMEWNYFFRVLGVQDNIEFINLDYNCRSFRNYHEDQMSIIFGLNSQQVHGYKDRRTLTFLEFTEDSYQFACLFWSYIISNINIYDLNRSEIAYWGIPNGQGATRGSEVNTFPQWFVRTKSCIPNKISTAKGQYKEQCIKAREVFIGSLQPLIGYYLPICDFFPYINSQTDEWQIFFRFKTELTIDDCFYLLQQIYIQNQNEIDSEDDTRIQDIYNHLLNKLSETDHNQRESYRKKFQSMNLCLLSDYNNSFMPPEELNIWSINTFTVPRELYRLKLSGNNPRHPNLSCLLYIFNVNEIKIKNLKLISINANKCDELINRLEKSSLLLLLDFCKFEKTDKINRLDNMIFFEADRLEVYIDNLDPCVGYPDVYEDNNRIFVKKPWNSSSVSLQLSKKMCELLSLPTAKFETHISHLITAAFIDDYFNEIGMFSKNKQLLNKDNLDLLNRLKHSSPSLTPVELLIAGLEEQNSLWNGYIYHYTHLENAISILRDQSIKSRYLCGNNNFKDSSAYDFMSQKNDRVNHYARFYFRPQTLTQFNNENFGSERSKKRNGYSPICPVPIFFCINLQSILNNSDFQWKVSLGDMSNSDTEYNCTLDVIKQFDFCGLFKDIITERGKSNAQLEFLIEDQLDFKLLPKDAITVVC
ncbi:unnamed protein product [Adineta steineri]|uniref:DarT domain-containing protein n=1 Tax=Adineta steineri TaxID=433720 RepID=A0A814LFB2_9BILA|nr:unnamed protein product [Adineta steineri]CAF3674019.1 unnamed protein product [Adineta steineri]